MNNIEKISKYLKVSRKIMYVTTMKLGDGYHAVMMVDEDGVVEPFTTGSKCKTEKDAIDAAKEWAKAENVKYMMKTKYYYSSVGSKDYLKVPTILEHLKSSVPKIKSIQMAGDGWNLSIANGEKLYVEVEDNGDVVWSDFSHNTYMGKSKKPLELIKNFTTLLSSDQKGTEEFIKKNKKSSKTAHSKSDLPDELKGAFRTKPYDVYLINDYFKKIKNKYETGYSGVDTYTTYESKGAKPKFLSGKDFLDFVVYQCNLHKLYH